MNKDKATKEDYIYCEDCEMYADFWKYDWEIKYTEHNGHNWRHVTDEELAVCVKDCEECGCFKEKILGQTD